MIVRLTCIHARTSERTISQLNRLFTPFSIPAAIKHALMPARAVIATYAMYTSQPIRAQMPSSLIVARLGLDSTQSRHARESVERCGSSFTSLSSLKGSSRDALCARMLASSSSETIDALAIARTLDAIREVSMSESVKPCFPSPMASMRVW